MYILIILGVLISCVIAFILTYYNTQIDNNRANLSGIKLKDIDVSISRAMDELKLTNQIRSGLKIDERKYNHINK